MNTKILAVVPLLLAAGTGLAQSPRDSDGDERISLEEFQAKSAERFARLDTDGDGYLSRSELRAGMVGPGPGMRRSPRAARGGERLDTDGDGLLTLAELQVRFPDMDAESFVAADEDGDGYVNPEELRATFRGRRGGPGSLVARADGDGDGELSLSELQALRPELTSEQFARLDANGDGSVSPDELRRRHGPRR